jgi:glycine oxidase
VKGSRADVAIVGGGVIGCALARELAGRGASVAVIEKAQPGEEASGAAAGLLAPQAENLDPGPLFDLAVESRDLYPGWTTELENETGMEVGYRRCGILRCAVPGDPDALEGYSWQRAAGLAVERLGSEEIAAASAGAVSPEIRDALLFPRDGLVDNRRLVEALRLSAIRRGAMFTTGTAARRFLVREGRCIGVETDGGPIAAERTVNAAGAWAGFDPLFAVPIEPVRGQIVEIQSPNPGLAAVIESEDVYIVPRRDSLLLGSTTERVGFVKQVTAGAVEKLLAAATRLIPALEGAAFLRAWSGLRPATPDGLPLLGESRLPGLWLAAGHFRNGILLAPVTALAIADDILGHGSRNLTPFTELRFGESAVGTQCLG